MLYPVGLTGGALHFIRMVMANAVGGNVVSETVVSTLVVVVVIVVVVVGVVATGLSIVEVVDVVTIVGFAVMLNDIAVRIRVSAICTDGCCDDASFHHVVADVLNSGRLHSELCYTGNV